MLSESKQKKLVDLTESDLLEIHNLLIDYDKSAKAIQRIDNKINKAHYFQLLDNYGLTDIQEALKIFNSLIEKNKKFKLFRETERIAVEILNRTYSIINLGGKCRIAFTGLKGELKNSPFKDFQELTKHLKLKTRSRKRLTKDSLMADIFINSEYSNRFDEINFNPAYSCNYIEQGKAVFNLFCEFSLQSIEKELKNYKPREKANLFDFEDKAQVFNFVVTHYPTALRFFEHVFNNIADGEFKAGIQFIAWLCDMLQNPQNNPHFAVVLRSKGKGTGKGSVAHIIENLLGEKYFKEINTIDELTGKFNSHLANRLCVFLDEPSIAKASTESIIKNLITSKNLNMTLKGVDSQSINKYFRLLIASNYDFVVRSSEDERRYLVFNVNDAQKQNSAYFKPFYDCSMVHDLFAFFMNCDYSGIDLFKAINTQANDEQKEFVKNQDSTYLFLSDCVEREKIELKNKSIDLNKATVTQIAKADLFDAYLFFRDRVKNSKINWIPKLKAFNKQLTAHFVEAGCLEANFNTRTAKLSTFTLPKLEELEKIFK